MQMLIDVGWSPKIAVKPWRVAIMDLHEMLAKAEMSTLNPTIAFCMWIACRACVSHSRFFDHLLHSAISFFLQALQNMGRSWSLAEAYADHCTHFAAATREWSTRQSREEADTNQTRQPSPVSSTTGTTPMSRSTPATLLSEDDTLLLSCIDWSKIEVDEGGESGSSLD
jgi:hypothetical protein